MPRFSWSTERGTVCRAIVRSSSRRSSKPHSGADPMPMNPLAEARAKLGDEYEVRVLEPSPPAVAVDPFSDDPMARGDVPEGRTLVSPFDTGVPGDLTWDALAHENHQLAEWCAHRALGALALPPPLADVDAFVATR